MVQFNYCLCFASQETASVAAPIVLIDQRAASEHHSVAWCMQRESGGRAILNVYKVGEPSSMTKYECFGNVSTHDALRITEVMLHYTARRVHWTFR